MLILYTEALALSLTRAEVVGRKGKVGIFVFTRSARCVALAQQLVCKKRNTGGGRQRIAVFCTNNIIRAECRNCGDFIAADNYLLTATDKLLGELGAAYHAIVAEPRNLAAAHTVQRVVDVASAAAYYRTDDRSVLGIRVTVGKRGE